MRQYILIVILLFVASSSEVNAQTRDSLVVKEQVECESSLIHFRFAKSVVDSGYMDNSISLRELDRILNNKSTEIDSVLIIASGSPDGVIEYNQALAVRRAKAVKGYLIWKYPFLNQFKIFTHSIGEDWAGLRRLVEADSKVPYKEQILKTLSAEVNPATKEWRLKQIDGGKAWSYITSHYLRYLRAATTCVVYYKKQEVELPKQVESVKQPIQEVAVVEKVQVEPEQKKEDTMIAIEPIVAQSIFSPQVKPINKPLFAIKTNLLELAAGVANVGLEVRLGRKLSLDIPFTYSPYTISSDYRIRVMMLRPELRYWFRDTFDGHFVGVHGIGGAYNVSVNSDTRYQSNRMAYGVGLSYGYAFRLSKHWGVELSLGAGYVNTSYDCYYNVPNGMLYDSRNKHYWGVTRASVGIVYQINRKR